ncbi:MAG: beta-galactosidase [Clostridia bacterium]|nr:beta-galactosidase [Clostridia bacterium]
MRFTYQKDIFLLDNAPFQILSGAIHYFRTPACCWKDRLLKLKECGFNTVETYVAWNVHEEKEGEFDFSKDKDLGAFLDTAQRLGLKAIVRPGPYICAEWEMGGLPPWLLRYPNMHLRCNDPLYLEKVEGYIAAIAPILRPRLIENGGNILMLQVENEYGSYGNDSAYLLALKALYEKYGLNALAFTSDGASVSAMENGKCGDCLVTANFGEKAEYKLPMLSLMQKDAPYMCAEFWCGWFDQWHAPHHTRETESILKETEYFLQNGYSFNVYMFHGGTNFGFMNGANYYFPENPASGEGTYKATVTSYDYGAFLTEAGDRTPTYYAVKALIEKHTGVHIPLTATDSEKRAYGKVQFTQKAELFNNLANLGDAISSITPLSMEECGQNYGYILYKSELSARLSDEFRIMGLADRANIFVDGKPFAIAERSQTQSLPRLVTGDKTSEIALLVENMGRVNYGVKIGEKKGIQGVRVWERQLFHWETVCLPMNNLEKLVYEPCTAPCAMPTFYKGSFTVDKLADTFIAPRGFKKGFILVNGRNIGRYYTEAGPQRTLFIPKCYLREGENELVVFDSDGANELFAELVRSPEL